MGFEQILLIAGTLLLVSILVNKLSEKTGIPSLIVFLLIGMLAGSEALGRIYFDDIRLAQSIGVIALIYILFSGGLDTRWHAVRPYIKEALLLSTAGVLITALAVGLFSHYALGLPLLQSLLLGSIISSTDAAAVFSVFRSRNVSMPDNLRSLTELESGSNDPMAVFLTVTTIQAIMNPTIGVHSFILSFVLQMILGSLLGFIFAKVLVFLLNRLDLGYPGLYPAFTFSMILLSFGAISLLGGNGFLAVYIIGLILGNSKIEKRKMILEFYDGIAWLMQIVMFIVLGLLVFPSRLIPVALHGIGISIFLMLVARPIGVSLTLVKSKFSTKEKTMLSWMGLKGAVPIILATFPLLAGVEGAETIFNIVFFVVLTSTLIQGTTVTWVTKLLGLSKKRSG